MMKHKKMIRRVFLIVVFVSIIGITSMLLWKKDTSYITSNKISKDEPENFTADQQNAAFENCGEAGSVVTEVDGTSVDITDSVIYNYYNPTFEAFKESNGNENESKKILKVDHGIFKVDVVPGDNNVPVNRLIRTDSSVCNNLYSKYSSEGEYILSPDCPITVEYNYDNSSEKKLNLKLDYLDPNNNSNLGASCGAHYVNVDVTLDLLPKLATPTVENTNIAGICSILNSVGTDHENKWYKDSTQMNGIDANAFNRYKEMYNGNIASLSAEAVINDLVYYVPDCNPNISISSVTDPNSIKSSLEAAINFLYLRYSLKSSFSGGSSASSWSVDFEKIKNQAASGAAEKFELADTDLGEDGRLIKNKNFKLYCDRGAAFKGEDASGNIILFDPKFNVADKSSADYKEVTMGTSSGFYQYDEVGNYNITANEKNYYFEHTSVKSLKPYVWDVPGTGDVAAVQYDGSFSTDSGSCVTKCAEAIRVNYGPPIASKAGFCFEYQVRLTSKVLCTADIQIKPPKKGTYCEPTPWCNNGLVAYIHQAGPNEEFEGCINQCDGGKYSKKCSDKCYKSVYGNDKTLKSKKTTAYFADLLLSKVDRRDFAGKYAWVGGSILWLTDGVSRPYPYSSFSRYYLRHPGVGNWAEYVANYGIKTHLTWAGLCRDRCYFGGCYTNQYLNADDVEADYQNNLNIQNANIGECKATASCTTSTATFKMSVSYSSKEDINESLENSSVEKSDELWSSTETKEIEFPYTPSDFKPSKLESKQSESDLDKNDDICLDKSMGKVTTKDSVILEYNGCYKGCKTTNEYHAHISFPGYWRNNKDWKLYPEKPITEEGWQHFPNKYCIQSDAANVNSNYWYWYYGHADPVTFPKYENDSDDTTFNGLSIEKIREKAASSVYNTNSKVYYNIKAFAENFGHFGASFEVSCFYSLASDCEITKETGFDKCDSDFNAQYKKRAVDLTDLFPAGSKSGSDYSASKYSADKSVIPFNWSYGATIDEYHSSGSIGLVSYPNQYGVALQQAAADNQVYTDDELEYQFHLTPKDLRSIKNFATGNSSYDSSLKYEGIYISKMFRGESSILDSSIVRLPGTSVLSCNNIRGIKGIGSGTVDNNCEKIGLGSLGKDLNNNEEG